MRKNWIIPAAVFAISGAMQADTITNTTGTLSLFPSSSSIASSTPTWISTSTQPTTTGSPFWNNPSDDVGVGGSHQMNIGYILTDTGGMAGMAPVLGSETVSSYLSGPSGSDPATFSFVKTQTLYNITTLFARSSLNTGNATMGTVFGSYTGSTYAPIYTVGNTNSPTGAKAFLPTTTGNSYGFYVTECYGPGDCETYTTGNGNSGSENGAAAWNHFALFQLTDGNFVLGFTGTTTFSGEALGDFQDVVVELTAIPEPSTIALLALGLAALGLWQERRNRSRSVEIASHAPTEPRQ